MGTRGPRSSADRAAFPALVVTRPRRAAVSDSPRTLGEHGAALWQRVASEYEIDSASAREQLCLACEALDRAEACAAQIKADGLMRGERENPLLKHEIQARAFVARTLQRLELEL